MRKIISIPLAFAISVFASIPFASATPVFGMALKAAQAALPQLQVQVGLPDLQPKYVELQAQVGPPDLQPKYVEIASVISGPGPSSGQKNRSSGNFSIDSLPLGTSSLYWQVVTQDGQSIDPNISFNVMDDRSAASDPVIFRGVFNGAITSVRTDRSYYISNPSGANQNFIVKVYAVYY